eukprot:Clim_evm39s109 gene=Clim_evmTU39s109
MVFATRVVRAVRLGVARSNPRPAITIRDPCLGVPPLAPYQSEPAVHAATAAAPLVGTRRLGADREAHKSVKSKQPRANEYAARRPYVVGTDTKKDSAIPVEELLPTDPIPDPLAKFDETAEDYYSMVSKFTKRFNADVIKMSGFQAGNTAIEVAAGPGDLSMSLAEQSSDGFILATDCSKSMTDIMKKRIDTSGMKHIVAEPQNGTRIVAFSDYFDFAFNMFGLHFFDSPIAGIIEMARVVKPGGKVVIANWAPPESNPYMKLIFKAMDIMPSGRKVPELENPRTLGDPSKLAEYMSMAGLENIDIVRTEKPFYSAPNQMVEEVKIMDPTIGEALDGMPDMQQAKIESEMANRIDTMCPNTNSGDPFTCKAVAILAVGTKRC